MTVVQTKNNALEMFPGFLFAETALADQVLKQLTAFDVFQD